jgi:hypothetical protein
MSRQGGWNVNNLEDSSANIFGAVEAEHIDLELIIVLAFDVLAS